MGKFDKASKNIDEIKKIAMESNERANIVTIKYFEDDLLLDYEKNNEDISDTVDIENSIKELGFTDPIEITDFNFEKTGKYIILSGHRRRMAGRKQGMSSFPCIVRHFQSESQIRNYVLLSNSHRDSDKDPLLLARRCLGNFEYLKEIGYKKGEVAEEVARRMGRSVAQVKRYYEFNKAILPIQNMVFEETVGLSSVVPIITSHSEKEQNEIFLIMSECLENNGSLTRETVKDIVMGYREGKRTWLDIIQHTIVFEAPKGNTQSFNASSVLNVNSDIKEDVDKSGEDESPLRTNEINYDFSHREELPQKTNSISNELPDDDDYKAINKKVENDKKSSSGEKVIKTIDSLENLLNSFYELNKEDTEIVLEKMKSLVSQILSEMYELSEKNSIISFFDEYIINLKKEINGYCE